MATKGPNAVCSWCKRPFRARRPKRDKFCGKECRSAGMREKIERQMEANGHPRSVGRRAVAEKRDLKKEAEEEVLRQLFGEAEKVLNGEKLDDGALFNQVTVDGISKGQLEALVDDEVDGKGRLLGFRAE